MLDAAPGEKKKIFTPLFGELKMYLFFGFEKKNITNNSW